MVSRAAVFGGETPAYSDLLDEASASSTYESWCHAAGVLVRLCLAPYLLPRWAALVLRRYKLMREAQQLGATDVVNVRYQTTSTMNRLVFGMHVSVMGYGTVRTACSP